jgi:hypothetical protein
VVFDQVTSAGNTQGPVVQEPLVDPYTPIKNGTLDITTTAGYSGNVTVTMSYAGYQLLEYQEAAITMLHEEGDGWRDITLSRDTQEKTVTGQASGLSRFTLQIAPASAPATATWYLAEGSTDYGFDCYITIENPNDSAVKANVTYMTGEGPVDGGVVSLPAKSQATINPRDTLGNKDFSTKVVCNEAQIIAVDRTMTWTGPGAASPEAHNSIGVTGSHKGGLRPTGHTGEGDVPQQQAGGSRFHRHHRAGQQLLPGRRLERLGLHNVRAGAKPQRGSDRCYPHLYDNGRAENPANVYHARQIS